MTALQVCGDGPLPAPGLSWTLHHLSCYLSFEGHFDSHCPTLMLRALEHDVCLCVCDLLFPWCTGDAVPPLPCRG